MGSAHLAAFIKAVSQRRAARLARPRVRKHIPRQQQPNAIRLAYSQALQPLLERMRALVETHVVSQLPELVAAAGQVHDSAITKTNYSQKLSAAVAKAARELFAQFTNERLRKLALQYGSRTADFQKSELAAQFVAGLGFDPLKSEPWLKPVLKAFAHQNADLIKSVPEKYFAEIESRTLEALRTGQRAEDIAKDYQARFGVSESRARLIARDQIGKLNGQLNISRQRRAGIKQWVWRTSEDERVRPEHEELDGKTFGIDAAPSEGYPGEPINCRCTAEPDVQSEIDALGDEPAQNEEQETTEEANSGAGGGGGSGSGGAPSLADILVSGEEKSIRPLGGGMMDTYKLEIDDGAGQLIPAVFKPRSGEKQARANVKVGTYADREEAASRVAEAIGYDRVPLTRKRHVSSPLPRKSGPAGDGSAQLFSEVAEPGDNKSYGETWGTISKLEGEKFRAFDYLIGNTDRHDGNLLWANGELVLIDHGLSFPSSAQGMFVQNPGILERGTFGRATHEGPFSAKALSWIRGIDAEAVASAMKQSGVDRDAAVHALRRLERLRVDQSFLCGAANLDPYHPRGHSMVNKAMAEPTQGLTPSALARVDKVISRVY